MNIYNTFKNKVLLITGGTGSFGEAFLSRFLKSDIKEIRILSRDEKKQEDMRIKYKNEGSLYEFKKNFLNLNDIKKMIKNGHIFGAHTYSHVKLGDISTSFKKLKVVVDQCFGVKLFPGYTNMLLKSSVLAIDCCKTTHSL